MKKRPPGWKKRPRKSRFDSIPAEEVAAALRECGTLEATAKKLGCGAAVVRRLIDKHSLQAAWNEGHDAWLVRCDQAREPERQRKRDAVSADLASAEADAAKYTGVLFNAWSIPMSAQKKAEAALAESISLAKLQRRRLRTLSRRKSA